MTIKRDLRCLGLHTVCESARCPNIHECFHRGTATFLILGNVAPGAAASARSRAEFRRCAGSRGAEPLARMARACGCATSSSPASPVTTCPTAASGTSPSPSAPFAARSPRQRIEVLTPDFQGDPEAIRRVLEAGPRVFNHNLETVARLYPLVRPQADYRRSLDVLRTARSFSPNVVTKSGLMLGLGEERREVEQLLGDLREAGVDVVTIGQYLPPSRAQLPVVSYVPPEQFEAWRDYALALGFREVVERAFGPQFLPG